METIAHRAKYGSYRVKLNDTGKPEILGRGKCGVTLRASLEGSAQDFAVKILRSDENSASRAIKEIQALRSLKHPNLVNCIDAETSSDGDSYIVMELCEGGSLAAFAEKHDPLPESAVAGIARQVVGGLAETHAKGYLHCDLKPSNLLLGKVIASIPALEAALVANPGLVKLGDFGLATELSRESPDHPTKFRGTALFASPEQFQEKPLDVRSDLYSLGMTLWYLLSGGAPLTAAKDSGKIDIKSLSRFHTDSSAHLDHPAMKSLQLSPPFRALLGKLLAKDKAERFSSAAEVGAALEKCLYQKAPQDADPGKINGVKYPLPGKSPVNPNAKGPVEPVLKSMAGTDGKSAETLQFTFWKAAQNSANDSAQDLSTYLAALRCYSLDQEKGTGDCLLPVVSVSRTQTEWCIAEPLVRGIPLTAIFGLNAPAPLDEAEKVLRPLAETIDRMLDSGLDRGQVSIDSVYIVAADNPDYFTRGRCLDEPMRDWPEWKIRFSGLSLPPAALSGNHTGNETNDFSTATASFDGSTTTVPGASANSHSDETVELNSNGGGEPRGGNLSCVTCQEGLPDQGLFSSFCRLVFRLLSGQEVPVAASWAPGAFVPAERLTAATNDLLRNHISGQAATSCSASRLISTIIENESPKKFEIRNPKSELPSTGIRGQGSDVSDQVSVKHQPSTDNHQPSSPPPSSGPKPLLILLSRGLALGVVLLIATLLGRQLFRERAPAGKSNWTSVVIPVQPASVDRPDSIPAAKSEVPATHSTTPSLHHSIAPVVPTPAPAPQPVAVTPPVKEEKIVQAEKPAAPPELDLSKIPADDADLNLLAARSPQASPKQKHTFLQNAARAFSSRGEKTRARNVYLELADSPTLNSQSATLHQQRARYLAEADQIASLGMEEWTEIQDHAGPGELRDKYRDKVLGFLALTNPETAFTRLMEYAGQATSNQEKTRFYSRAIALSSLPKPRLRMAYEKLAETGGFGGKLQLYDFLLSVTLFQPDASRIGREIVFSGVTGEHLADRTRVARDLWERFHDPEALKWIANNLAEGTERQKARWDYYTETQSPEYADAAKLLAEDKLLSPLSRGRYAWLYFNTVSPDSRKKGDFGKFLEQAVAAGVSEATLYRQQVQQVEESRVAAESVMEAASRFTLATTRIDQLIEKIGAQKIEKDGKLDVAAYEQKIYSLNALLEEIRKNEGPTSMEPQQGNIHWSSFTTWETAVGLKVRNSPFSSRSPGSIDITPEAMEDLTKAIDLGNLDAKARLASILAGTNPVKPAATDLKKAAQLAGEVYKSGKAGQTEARLVLRHLLNTSTKSRQTASAVLKSMDIDSAQILGSN